MQGAPRKILVSAGESSGDFYAAELVSALRKLWPECQFFGTAGSHMRLAGVRDVIRTEDLAVVGLVEVVGHLPRIWSRFQTLIRTAKKERPDFAVLTDSPDFHFRVARKLKGIEVPVVYLVAPQVWAWRQGRVKQMRQVIDLLLVIFPFEEQWFRERRVAATYIGHPLATRVRARLSREEFFRKHNLPLDRPLLAILPGSRKSEARRHLPELIRAAEILERERPMHFLLPASPTCGAPFFEPLLAGTPIRAVEGEAWEAMAHCDVALAASGTVTVEAALLGAPMVTFYRVTGVSWAMGKLLVKVPFFSMVNLIAEKKVVPELMQSDMTGERLAAETIRLLDSEQERGKMKDELRRVADRLRGSGEGGAREMGEFRSMDAIARAALAVEGFWEGKR